MNEELFPSWLLPPRPPDLPARVIHPMTEAEREEAEREERQRRERVARGVENLRLANLAKHQEKLDRLGLTEEQFQEKRRAENAEKARGAREAKILARREARALAIREDEAARKERYRQRSLRSAETKRQRYDEKRKAERIAFHKGNGSR